EWNAHIRDFELYLRLEKFFSENSIEAYKRDIEKLVGFLDIHEISKSPQKVDLQTLRDFLYWLNMIGIGERSQARIISGIKAFFSYLWLEKIIKDDPTELIEAPRIGKHLPEVLSIQEIDKILAAIDLSNPLGQRNKAIIETLYSCGYE